MSSMVSFYVKGKLSSAGKPSRLDHLILVLKQKFSWFSNWKLHILGNPVLGKLDNITLICHGVMPVGCWKRGTGSKDMPKASGSSLGYSRWQFRRDLRGGRGTVA